VIPVARNVWQHTASESPASPALRFILYAASS
jgi:hypothetical protein